MTIINRTRETNSTIYIKINLKKATQKIKTNNYKNIKQDCKSHVENSQKRDQQINKI